MANYTATTDLTLEQCITNGPMTNGDVLTIENGATVTMTETNSVLIDDININNGEFFIDGANISSGNLISLVQNYQSDTNVRGAGVYRITGDWYDLGTTDGTDSQSISLTTFYGGDFECVINGIWVETGRRINFDNSAGTTPVVNDWVYKVSDKDVMGRIVEVQSTYLVVKYLVGTLADDDEIEVVKVVENSNGPDYEVSWTADVNHASGDIREAGVYQEFGNAVWDETSYINDFGDKMGGFVFAHLPEATTLVMGHSTNGGFVPPSGCNIRVPNVNLTTSNTTNFPLGTVYNDRTTTPGNRNEIRTSNAGEIRFNKCNVGNQYFYSSNAYVFESYYVASNVEFGSTECGTKVIIENNIGTACPWSSDITYYYYFNGFDLLNGVDLKDSYIVFAFYRYSSVSFSSSYDVNIENCIISYSAQATAFARGFYTSRCNNVTLDNNIVYCGGHASNTTYFCSLSYTSNITIKNSKICGTPKGNVGSVETPMLYFDFCNNILIKGVELLEGAITGDSFIYLNDCKDTKIRCMGMIDRKSTFNSSDFEYIVYFGGYAINADIARIWCNNSNAAYYGAANMTNTCKDILIQNCSSGYTTRFATYSADNCLLKGVHSGAGNPGSSDGIDDSGYNATYGWAIHDGFRSDTVGFIVNLMIPDTINTSSSVTITAGDPKLMKDGTLDMVSGDVIEFEQSYFAKGHISFPGTYTSAIGGSAWNANEWTNVTIDFQYDVGSGWSGTWLDVRTASNWTGITITAATGVKLKFRLTATGTQTSMTMLIIDTVTSIATQKANQYPIDQVECDVNLNGIIDGSRYWIYDSDTSTELAEGTASTDPVTETVNVPDGTNLLIRVRKSSASVKYLPFSTTAITNTTEIDVAIIQVEDGIVT